MQTSLPVPAIITTALLLSVSPARAQIVSTAALQNVASTLALNEEALAGMPLKGAGQKIPFHLAPAPAGLTVNNVAGVPVPVKVSVTGWRVHRAGNPLVENTDYKIVANDPFSASATFVFKTKAVHHEDNVAVGSDLTDIEADLKLEAGDPLPATGLPANVVQTVKREQLKVPRLGIPKILALFRHPSYAPTKNGVAGFVLVLLPSNSPLGSFPGVTNFLDQLQDALTNLSWVTSFAGAASRIALLQTAIAAAPNPRVKVGGEDDLHDITMINHAGGNDTYGNDTISSLLFLADDGYRAYLFNDDNYQKNEGWFQIEAGDKTATVIAVSSLAKRTPTTSPSGHLTVKVPSDNGETFNNKISSIRFSAP